MKPCKHLVTLVLFTVAMFPVRAYSQASSADPLLEKTSREVSAYLEQVSDVRCSEHVEQLKLDPKGHSQYHQEATYDYLVILDGSRDQLLLNESRLLQHQSRQAPQSVSMLLSNGFSDLFLIFHPYYRSGFDFIREPDQVIAGQNTAVVAFRHLEGGRTPAAIAVRNRQYPLDLTGLAWIDPNTGMVMRIHAELAKDMSDVGLRSLKADVYYTPVQLAGWEPNFRLPSKAVIEVETLRQSWRNIHQFTNYQRFTVDTQVAVSKEVHQQDAAKDPNP